jgi:hypothetical protein
VAARAPRCLWPSFPGLSPTKRSFAKLATTAPDTGELPPTRQRKFFYAFTCELLQPLRVAFFLAVTGYRLLLDDWRGYLISFFAVAGMANVYLSLFGRLRVDIKSERLDVAAKEEAIAGDSAAATPTADATPGARQATAR